MAEYVEVRRWGDEPSAFSSSDNDEDEQRSSGEEDVDEDGEWDDDDEAEGEEDEEDEEMKWQDDLEDTEGMDEGVEWADVPYPVNIPLPNSPLLAPTFPPRDHLLLDDDDFEGYSDDECCPESTDGASTSGTTLSGYPSTSGSLVDEDEVRGGGREDVEWRWEEREY